MRNSCGREPRRTGGTHAGGRANRPPAPPPRSFFEIFNESVFDLLDAAGKSGLSVREDQQKGVYVSGLGKSPVDSASSASQVLLKGYRNRRVAETAMNRESSRSHAVFQLMIESVETVEAGASPAKHTGAAAAPAARE